MNTVRPARFARRAIAWLAIAALLAAPGAHAVPPFLAAPAKAELLPEEDRVWVMSEDMDRSLRRKGALLDAPELNRYLQRIMDRLYPEFAGTLRVKAIDDASVNAFCMANGSVYMHLGMLARMGNESQIATVLAHEGAHFLHRHSYQNLQSVQSGSAFALGATILFGGIGALIGGLAGVSSVAGFSRDLEREADRSGFDRLVTAGYDAGEAHRAFEVLAAVAKVEDKSPPYMFASHPRVVERIESFQELARAKAVPAARPRADEMAFGATVLPLRETWLKRELGLAKFKHVIHWLTQDNAAQEWPAHFRFYLGEAYRLRNEKDDAELAITAYRKAIEDAPQFADSLRALGIALHKKNDAEAPQVLRRYLAAVPDAADRSFIEPLIDAKK